MGKKEFFSFVPSDYKSYVKPALWDKVTSPYFQLVSSHYALRDYCRAEHPEVEEFRCAVTYFKAKLVPTYDELHVPVMYSGYRSADEALKPYLDNIFWSKMLLYIAFFIYMLEIRIPQRYVLCLVAGLSLFFSRNELFKIKPRYNVDLESYIQ